MSNSTGNWKDMIEAQVLFNKEDPASLTHTLSPSEYAREFNDGYGGSEGMPFTAWTTNYVYFPVVYDGSEWVGSAPRNRCDIETDHQGGE
jgi:hypothetical protein